jgi:hypothetical protein
LPHYTENNDQGTKTTSKTHESSDVNESLWKRITSDAVAFVTLCLAFVTAILAVSTIGFCIVTWSGGIRQSRETQRTIDTMEQTERRQLRAYVGVNTINIELPHINELNWKRLPPFRQDTFTLTLFL